MAEFAKQQFEQIARDRDIRLLAWEAIVDHVHLVIDVPNRAALSKAMNYLKGTSSRRLGQQFLDLKADSGIETVWQRRYGSKEVERGALPNTLQYVRTQWDRLEDYDR